MQPPINIALIGAGNRGQGVFGQYGIDMPHRARFVAVVDPVEKKRNRFGDEHSISPDKRFENYEQFFETRDERVDAVVIATLENERKGPIFGAMKNGYHILVEKPLGTDLKSVVEICDAAKAYSKIFMVCHQMRYTALYHTLKLAIDSGMYGRPISVQHSENLSYHHMAHSFVRGLFSSSALSPMILQKACHDMDLIRWIVDSEPVDLSSYGSLLHFRQENAPVGAAERCLNNCPVERACPYSALKIYFSEDTDPAYLRQMGSPSTPSELRDALTANQFGRCVYNCDNDVVDNQVVIVRFKNGVTANFSMTGHNVLDRRITKVSLTNGELELDVSSGFIKAWTFHPSAYSIITPESKDGSHLGGDMAIMNGFVDAIVGGDYKNVLTPVGMSLDSHVMAFAAEESRISGRSVNVAEFVESYRR